MKIIEWKELLYCYEHNQVFSYFEGKKSGISVGSFDGLHLGHKALMYPLNEICKKNSWISGVFTFSRPLPYYKHSEDYAGDISTLNQRFSLFDSLGLDFVIYADFNPEFAVLKGIEFFDIIKKTCNLNLIVEGFDFRCGYKGATDTQSLKYWAEENKIEYRFVEPVFYKEGSDEEERISSSFIRIMIQKGFFATVQELLQRPYEIDLSAVQKKGDNKKIVIEKQSIKQVIPPDGVYRINYNGENYRLSIKDANLMIENADMNITSISF